MLNFNVIVLCRDFSKMLTLWRRAPALQLTYDFSGERKIKNLRQRRRLFEIEPLENMFHCFGLHLRTESSILSHRGPDDLIVGIRRELLFELQIASEEGNRSGSIFLDMEKSLVGAAQESFHLRPIRLQRSVPDENAALQLDQILLRKGNELAKSGFLRFERNRGRKHSGINGSRLQSGENCRHHSKAKNRDVAIGIETILSQDLAQQRIRAAADSGDADALSF